MATTTPTTCWLPSGRLAVTPYTPSARALPGMTSTELAIGSP